MKGVIGVLSGRTEPLVEANHKRMNKSPQAQVYCL